MGAMNSIPTFEEACKITRFPTRQGRFIPDGSELAYAEAFLIPHMSPQEYKKLIAKRRKRLDNIEITPFMYRDSAPTLRKRFIGMYEAIRDNKETDEQMLRLL